MLLDQMDNEAHSFSVFSYEPLISLLSNLVVVGISAKCSPKPPTNLLIYSIPDEAVN